MTKLPSRSYSGLEIYLVNIPVRGFLVEAQSSGILRSIRISSKQYSRGNVLMPGRFLTTTSDAFVSYVTAYDFIHQPEGCIDVDRPLWRDLRERTMEDDNPILLLYYIRK